MLRRLLSSRIDAMERQLGAPMDYVRFMLRTSLRTFFKFARFGSIAAYRHACPKEAMHVARLVAVRHEDCGTCVQIELNLARHDHVTAEVVRAALDDRPDDLPAELADVYHFATAVVEQRGSEGEYRERIRRRYGDEALIELSLGIAFGQVFPVVKRALGYATSCSVTRLQV